MSKKEKSVFVLAEAFQAMITVVPKLEAFLKIHNEIAASYQKYRNDGGEAISGIEKHLGNKEQKSAPSVKTKKVAPIKTAKVQEDFVETKKRKK